MSKTSASVLALLLVVAGGAPSARAGESQVLAGHVHAPRHQPWGHHLYRPYHLPPHYVWRHHWRGHDAWPRGHFRHKYYRHFRYRHHLGHHAPWYGHPGGWSFGFYYRD